MLFHRSLLFVSDVVSFHLSIFWLLTLGTSFLPLLPPFGLTFPWSYSLFNSGLNSLRILTLSASSGTLLPFPHLWPHELSCCLWKLKKSTKCPDHAPWGAPALYSHVPLTCHLAPASGEERGWVNIQIRARDTVIIPLNWFLQVSSILQWKSMQEYYLNYEICFTHFVSYTCIPFLQNILQNVRNGGLGDGGRGTILATNLGKILLVIVFHTIL